MTATGIGTSVVSTRMFAPRSDSAEAPTILARGVISTNGCCRFTCASPSTVTKAILKRFAKPNIRSERILLAPVNSCQSARSTEGPARACLPSVTVFPALFFSEPEHDAGRVPEVVLEAVTARHEIRKLRREVLHLDWLERNMIRYFDIDSSAGRCGKSIPRR